MGSQGENGMQRDSITMKQRGRGERMTTMECMGKSGWETEGNHCERKRLHDMERERRAPPAGFCVLPRTPLHFPATAQQPHRRDPPSEADWEYASAVLSQHEDFCGEIMT